MVLRFEGSNIGTLKELFLVSTTFEAYYISYYNVIAHTSLISYPRPISRNSIDQAHLVHQHGKISLKEMKM